MNVNYLADLVAYLPELLVISTMLVLLFATAFYKNMPTVLPYFVTFAGLILAFISITLTLENSPKMIFSNAITIDHFGNVIKLIMIAGTLAVTYLSFTSSDIYKSMKSDFLIIVVGILVGGMLLVSANNFLTLYLGIETLSILSYVIASFMKRDEASAEAGIKYALYGGISAGIMLYGISHIYGVIGSIEFYGVSNYIVGASSYSVAILAPAFIMFFVGIGYKIASVPFHMWAPDVYEGSPIPTTTFFSIVPKMAGIAALVRVTYVFFEAESALSITWVALLTVIAALTMTVGNVAAIGQRSIKRMLAYSSISHAGVMILGVLVINDIGTKSLVFYGVVYLFMTLVAFYVTSYISDVCGNDHIERFSGLVMKHPLMAITMTVTLFSLAGLPPFGGFVAKFNILYALIIKKYYTLAFIAVLNSVISLYYYMKVVRVMVFRPVESDEAVPGFTFLNQGIILLLGFPVLLLGIFWERLLLIAEGAKIFIH